MVQSTQSRRPKKSTRCRQRCYSFNWSWKQWLTRIAVPLVVSSIVHKKWNDSFTSTRSSIKNAFDGIIPCNFVMAESSLPHGGWGIYTLQDLDAGTPLSDLASPVIQFINLQDSNLQFPGLQHLLDSYMWSGAATLGQFEAHASHGLALGIGMLTNGHADPKRHNARPLRAHNAKHLHAPHGARRYESPVAGSATSYQEFTYETARRIKAGDELIIPYGPGWTEKMKVYSQREKEVNSKSNKHHNLSKPVEWLIENGRCLDHIRPVKLPDDDDRGYGIAANHPLQANERIMSVPLLPIHRTALLMPTSADQNQPKQQLALNYVIGHAQSNLLLVPSAPTFPLINHPRAPYQTANAHLEWDVELTKHWQTASVDEVLLRTPHGPGSALVANLVALRDIAVGEEIVLDYGRAWQDAWKSHVQMFESAKSRNHGQQQYPRVYPHDLNQQSSVLRDQREQQSNPYPANILSVCLWDSQAPIARTEHHGQLIIRQTTWSERSVKASVLLPCKILERSAGDNNGSNDEAYRYTVQIYEPDMGNGSQHLDQGEMWVVRNVPRQAITFVDRPYQSDQHLTDAFRHEMRPLKYPPQWLDTKR